MKLIPKASIPKVVKTWESILGIGLALIPAPHNATAAVPKPAASNASETGMSLFENDDQIVPLWKSQATARSKITCEVMEYWNSLRVGGILPKQAQLDPRGLQTALPYVFMLERVAPGIARIRVSGSHMNDLMGMEVKAMPITSFAAPGERANFLPLIDKVFDDPAIVELELEAKRAGYAPKAAEMLLLPVEDRHGQVTRALGCLVARGPIVFSPYRFRINSQRTLPLPRPVSTPTDWQPSKPRKVELAEEFKPFENAGNHPAKFRKTKVSHLQIVD